MRNAAKLFVALTVAAAIAAVLAVRWATPPGVHVDVTSTLVFAALVIVMQMAALRLPVQAGDSLSFLPALTAAVVQPHWVVPVMVAAAVTLSEVVRRAQPVKGVFNVAQMTLSTGVAILAYRALGGAPLAANHFAHLGAYVAFVLVYFAVNSAAVATVIALSQRGSIVRTWWSNSAVTLAYDLVAIPLVYCFGQLYLTMGTTGVVLLAFILLGARQLYSTSRQLEFANRDLLQVMVTAIEMRDPYTSGHSQRVSEYARVVGRAIGLSRREVERVATAALLHDVGKIDQRFAEILQKTGRLSDEERRVIEEHAARSAELVAKVSGLSDLVAPVRHHHERWDGRGYPDRLAGAAIPLYARIIAFADTIDAMTTDRPYRPALGPSEVRAELLKHRGTQFDPDITDALVASPTFIELFGRGTPPRGMPAVEPMAPAPVAPAPVAPGPLAPVRAA